MKILKFKGKISLKNRLLIALAIVIIISGISIGVIYTINSEFREWINVNILKKEITEDDVATISLDTDETQYIYAFDKYITILCNSKLEIYNSYASLVYELDISVSNPLFDANGQYLAIAENGRTKNISNK